MQEDALADIERADGNEESHTAGRGSTGPPKASLTRRSQSYSDFHDAVNAVLGRGSGSKERRYSQLEEKKEITTELDFVDWYHDIEHDLLDASHEEYTSVVLQLSIRRSGLLRYAHRIYKNQLDLSQSHLDSLITNTTSTLNILGTLSKSFKAVEAQTTTFQKQCEGLLQEQEQMTDLADNLKQNLRYYDYLEPVTRRLNAPGAGNFVRSKEFSDMLARLDECLEYMAAHVSLPIHAMWGNWLID